MVCKQSFRLIALLVLPLVMSACGKPAELKLSAVDMSTTQVDQRTYLNFEAQVTIGGLKFPNAELPILNPVTMTNFGQLALLHQADGTNKLMVSIDFETATRLNSNLGYSLPNGREIPLVLGAQNATLVGIPIKKSSRIYVGGDLSKEAFLGVALTISSFDSALNQVSIPLNIFSAFPFSNSVTGVGGLFTSPNAGQNGLAVFVKKSVQSNQSDSVSVLATSRSSTGRVRQAAVATGPRSNPTELEELDYNTLYRLNNMFNKRATIKIK